MNDLDKLKQLLFGAEKQALDSITQRVERREDRAVDVADILPEAIHDSHKRSKDLVESLRQPVGECLQQEFHDDPQTYSDALYPVIGPAIRKSIMQTLRTFAEQVNAAVEQSLTPRGLKWRLQAARAGVPFGEFVLQKTLLYRVEQAYLISRENGLLISHVHHEAAKIKDSDAVSAMFTAIQDFVKESFSPDRTGRLESADMGEFTLWAVHGPHALLVCVIRGVPPRSLRPELSAILERLHFRYGDAIRTYSGDTSSVPDVEGELERCLRFQARQTKEDGQSRRLTLPIMLLLFALVALLLYLGVARWMHSQALNRLIDTIQGTPGIYLSESQRKDDRIVLRGLRDPLAPPIAEIAASVGVAAEDIDADLSAYQSLDPEIVARRAASAFGHPDGVSFAVDSGRLHVSGPVTPDLRDRILAGLPLLAGVNAVTFTVGDNEREAITRQLLQPPGSVTLTAIEDEIRATGSAPAAWLTRAEQRLAQAELGWNVNLAAVDAGESERYLAALSALDGQQFYFSSGTTFRADDGDRLAAYARKLLALATSADELGEQIQVVVTGFADGSGTPEANAELSRRRADIVADILRAAGIAADTIAVRAEPALTATPVIDRDLRRVTIDIVPSEEANPE